MGKHLKVSKYHDWQAIEALSAFLYHAQYSMLRLIEQHPEGIGKTKINATYPHRSPEQNSHYLRPLIEFGLVRRETAGKYRNYYPVPERIAEFRKCIDILIGDSEINILKQIEES